MDLNTLGWNHFKSYVHVYYIVRGATTHSNFTPVYVLQDVDTLAVTEDYIHARHKMKHWQIQIYGNTKLSVEYCTKSSHGYQLAISTCFSSSGLKQWFPWGRPGEANELRNISMWSLSSNRVLYFHYDKVNNTTGHHYREIYGALYYNGENVSLIDSKGIKNGCPCIVKIRGTQGCALVGDPARAVGECMDANKAQP